MEIKVYTTSWCPECINSKRFMKENNLKFDEIDIEEKNMNRDDLEKVTGGRTVPQIVIDGKTIGGYNNLILLYQKGEIR
jgi:glutaredoxin